jgi:hypothetical protein
VSNCNAPDTALIGGSDLGCCLPDARRATIFGAHTASPKRVPPMPYRQEAEVVLEAWRAAQRRRDAAPPGSDGERMAAADLVRIRDEYRRLIQAARAAGRPEPPPFPES